MARARFTVNRDTRHKQGSDRGHGWRSITGEQCGRRGVWAWRSARRRMMGQQDLHQVPTADAATGTGVQVNGGDARPEGDYGLGNLWCGLDVM
jgi:hypothetical protein